MRNPDRIAISGDHEPNTLAQLHDVASRAERAALMADGHLGLLEAQKGTVEVLHTLRSLIVVMAGADMFDPDKNWGEPDC